MKLNRIKSSDAFKASVHTSVWRRVGYPIITGFNRETNSYILYLKNSVYDIIYDSVGVSVWFSVKNLIAPHIRDKLNETKRR